MLFSVIIFFFLILENLCGAVYPYTFVTKDDMYFDHMYFSNAIISPYGYDKDKTTPSIDGSRRRDSSVPAHLETGSGSGTQFHRLLDQAGTQSMARRNSDLCQKAHRQFNDLLVGPVDQEKFN